MLGHREYRAEVVCGMAETARRQERVEQVGIAHQHGVEERRLINRGASATDEGRRGPAAELLGVRADWFDELSIECAHGTGDAVEHVPLQRPHSAGTDVGGSRPDHEIGDLVNNVLVRHGFRPFPIRLPSSQTRESSGVHDQTPTCWLAEPLSAVLRPNGPTMAPGFDWPVLQSVGTESPST